jgi:hypothetical protein
MLRKHRLDEAIRVAMTSPMRITVTAPAAHDSGDRHRQVRDRLRLALGRHAAACSRVHVTIMPADARDDGNIEVRIALPAHGDETRAIAATLDLALAHALARLVIVLDTQHLVARSADSREGA